MNTPPPPGVDLIDRQIDWCLADIDRIGREFRDRLRVEADRLEALVAERARRNARTGTTQVPVDELRAGDCVWSEGRPCVVVSAAVWNRGHHDEHVLVLLWNAATWTTFTIRFERLDTCMTVVEPRPPLLVVDGETVRGWDQFDRIELDELRDRFEGKQAVR